MATRTEHDDIGQLRADIDNLKQDIQAMAADMKTLNGSMVDNAKAAVADRAQRAGDKVKDGVRTAHDAADRNIAEHPLAAVAIAIGVGLAAGTLLNRRH